MKGMKMRHLKRNLDAISPVLAVLMMIAVAIAGALVVYAWVMGYIDFSTEKSGQAFTVQSIANDQTDTDLLVYVQNVGEGVVQLDESGCLYVNGELVTCDITGVTVSEGIATLNEGETATLTYAEGAALPGVKIEVRVTSTTGGFSEKSDYPAGSARAAPAFDHFEFAEISSPQISSIPFSMKITAMDQYGDPYTSYIGANTLTYSDGDISPTSTGGFISGVWTGNVTVTGTATAAAISTVAVSEATWVGISNTFEVDAAVTFVSAGGGGQYTPTGNPPVDTSPTYPSGLEDGDLILLQIGIRDTNSVPDTPTGFTLLYGPDSTGYGRQWIYYKISNGAETGELTISVTGSPDCIASQMYAFRYVATSSFTEGASMGTGDTEIIYAEDVTTNGPRRMAVAFVYAMDNQEIESFTGETGGDWIFRGSCIADASMSMDDAIIVMQSALMLEEGTISGGSFTRTGVQTTPAGSTTWVVRAFALIPSD